MIDLARADDAGLIEAYLAHVRVGKRLAERTVALYTEDLVKLAHFAREAAVPLRQVQPAHVRRWIAQMHSAGRSPRGIALILSGWRGFYTWLGRQGIVQHHPVQDVRAPKAGKPLPKALAVDDAVRLAEHTQPDDDPGLEARDACITELLYGSGLRIGELVGRSVPVGRAALAALKRWLEARNAWARDDAALFIGQRGQRLTPQHIRVRLKRRALQAGLATPVHPHMLRHSFASHVLQSSGDLRAVQELLGHANIGTTQVYTRLDFQHLAQVYDAAHPRAQSRKPRGK